MGWGLPILSSDAISSVAYAGQEILSVLLPVVGVLAYRQMTYLSGVIILLLFILMISYRQTIEHYPNGGGAYIVAKANLGILPGVIAGAALAMDYILTVSVSIASGVQQIASAFAPVSHVTVPVCLALVLLMMLGNLRGMRDASRIFGIPTYMFIAGMLFMIVMGFVRLASGYTPPAPIMPTPDNLLRPLTMMLMLKAFSNGCAAVTGFEAVSNGVPNFREPARKNAKKVLLILTIIILALFGGTAIIAYNFRVVPDEHNALLVLIAGEIFGKGFMYYYISISAFVILILAANTAYSDFPMLLSVMSRDGYAPRQLSMRGGRLSYSSGIVVLSVVAGLLIAAFDARVDLLIGLYAIRRLHLLHPVPVGDVHPLGQIPREGLASEGADQRLRRSGHGHRRRHHRADEVQAGRLDHHPPDPGPGICDDAGEKALHGGSRQAAAGAGGLRADL